MLRKKLGPRCLKVLQAAEVACTDPAALSFSKCLGRGESISQKTLALFREKKLKQRRTTGILRWEMVALGRFVERQALIIVKPETFVKWHRTAFESFWRWKSTRPGRPPLPRNIRELVRQMSRENPTWGEERISNELSLKLGIKVAQRTVGKYLRLDPTRRDGDQRVLILRWVPGIPDPFQAKVPAGPHRHKLPSDYRVISRPFLSGLHHEYGLKKEAAYRRRPYFYGAQPQQFREFVSFDHPYRFLIHDRDGIFSPDLDAELRGFSR